MNLPSWLIDTMRIWAALMNTLSQQAFIYILTTAVAGISYWTVAQVRTNTVTSIFAFVFANGCQRKKYFLLHMSFTAYFFLFLIEKDKILLTFTLFSIPNITFVTHTIVFARSSILTISIWAAQLFPNSCIHYITFIGIRLRSF